MTVHLSQIHTPKKKHKNPRKWEQNSKYPIIENIGSSLNLAPPTLFSELLLILGKSERKGGRYFYYYILCLCMDLSFGLKGRGSKKQKREKGKGREREKSEEKTRKKKGVKKKKGEGRRL